MLQKDSLISKIELRLEITEKEDYNKIQDPPISDLTTTVYD